MEFMIGEYEIKNLADSSLKRKCDQRVLKIR
jgi:hypothetical protein